MLIVEAQVASSTSSSSRVDIALLLAVNAAVAFSAAATRSNSFSRVSDEGRKSSFDALDSSGGSRASLKRSDGLSGAKQQYKKDDVSFSSSAVGGSMGDVLVGDEMAFDDFVGDRGEIVIS